MPDSHLWQPTAKQARKIESQAKVCQEVLSVRKADPQDRLSVMEIFSPPRFTPIVEKLGLKSKAYNLKAGYDLSTRRDRERVEK